MSLSENLDYLLQLVEKDPGNWVLRKDAALKLYQDGHFERAADMVWSCPEIPSTDMDVGFAIKILSRAKPNRSIRMLYELVERNAGKTEQLLAMANVFNLIGYSMLAHRCYGNAMAHDPGLFDVGFEKEALISDEEHQLARAFSVVNQQNHVVLQGDFGELSGEPIRWQDVPSNAHASFSLKQAAQDAIGSQQTSQNLTQLNDAIQQHVSKARDFDAEKSSAVLSQPSAPKSEGSAAPVMKVASSANSAVEALTKQAPSLGAGVAPTPMKKPLGVLTQPVTASLPINRVANPVENKETVAEAPVEPASAAPVVEKSASHQVVKAAIPAPTEPLVVKPEMNTEEPVINATLKLSTPASEGPKKLNLPDA